MPYDPINQQSGVESVAGWLGNFGVSEDADGLVFAPPGPNAFGGEIGMPDRLRNWLLDLRLLRRIPLAYLIPDAALLPPESIRFFHVDQTWVDRVIDGVFAASNTGTVDFTFNCAMLAMVRSALDNDIMDIATQQAFPQWQPSQGMSGMLIRSELVRRWPDMVVRAYRQIQNQPDAPVPILRAEPISKDIYIALFAGEPYKVEVGEPNVGTRFGVECVNIGASAPPYKIDRRNDQGVPTGATVNIQFRNQSKRTLNILQLATDAGTSSRMVALQLEQRPYVQEFKKSRPELRGSLPLPENVDAIQLTKGRMMRLDGLKARLAQKQELEGGA